jgi:hypothetical protein
MFNVAVVIRVKTAPECRRLVIVMEMGRHMFKAQLSPGNWELAILLTLISCSHDDCCERNQTNLYCGPTATATEVVLTLEPTTRVCINVRAGKG